MGSLHMTNGDTGSGGTCGMPLLPMECCLATNGLPDRQSWKVHDLLVSPQHCWQQLAACVS
jgi:hypothetical protein